MHSMSIDNYDAEGDTVRNDNSSHYALTGERPQNFIRGSRIDLSLEEQPRTIALFQQKARLLDNPAYSIPPTYYLADAITPNVFNDLLPTRYDAILITPPKHMTFHELQQIDIASIASNPGFVWLWVGSGQPGSSGISIIEGQRLLESWGYRRCENIVWLKPGVDPVASEPQQDKPLFLPSIEHCLVGIRGTVRRSNDPWFVHCNIDTDVIVWPGDLDDPDLKPPELQSIIENFCLGTRRLHLFASKNALRRGWLCIGPSFNEPKYMPDFEYSHMKPVPYTPSYKHLWNPRAPMSLPRVLPQVYEIEALRPKSPPRNPGEASTGGLGRRKR